MISTISAFKLSTVFSRSLIFLRLAALYPSISRWVSSISNIKLIHDFRWVTSSGLLVEDRLTLDRVAMRLAALIFPFFEARPEVPVAERKREREVSFRSGPRCLMYEVLTA